MIWKDADIKLTKSALITNANGTERSAIMKINARRKKKNKKAKKNKLVKSLFFFFKI